jgi:hypothetical protein
MTRIRWLCFILALLLAGCGSGAKGPEGLILFTPQDAAGVLKPELVVVDTQGKEQRRIVLEDTVLGGYATQLSGRALVETNDDKVYLVDAKEGTAQRLGEKANARTLHFHLSGGGERWVLLGTTRGDRAYLVNLQTAEVHDLTTLGSGKAGPIFYGMFAPDEVHLVLGVDDELWLVPTARPGDARRVGSDKPTVASGFSSDSKQIAYVQLGEGGPYEAVVEEVDGSGSQVVASSAAWLWPTLFVPQQKQLVLPREDRLTLLSFGDGSERELLRYALLPTRLWFAPSGKKLLVGTDTDAGPLWQLVDVQNAAVQALEDLKGFQPLFEHRDQRWLFFLDNPSYGTGTHRFVGLDLESGETHEALALDEETMYMGVREFTADGKFGLLSAQTADQVWQLWLLRADGGEARLAAESSGASGGTFSPNGRWMAVSIGERVGERTETQLKLMATEGDETRELGAGIRPIWVRP